MKFFVPHTKAASYQKVYDGLAHGIKDQLKAEITARRVYAISYHQGKQELRLQVGEAVPGERRYQVMAIFESKPYLVQAWSKDGQQTITILIDPEQVTSVEDFT